MKKTAIIALFAALLLTLSWTAVQAQQPGCDTTNANGTWEIMKNRSDAIRVRDKAYSREIIKRNDPSLGLTCFDRAMGVTSRLGAIFSDTIDITGIANLSVFSASPDLTMGTGSILMNALGDTVAPVLKDYLGAFDPSTVLSSAFGALTATFMDALSPLRTAMTGITTMINGMITPIVTTLTTIQTTMNTIQTIADMLSIDLPMMSVMPYIAALTAARAAISAAMAAVMGAITGIIGAAISAITSAASGILGAGNAALNMNCDRFEDLWNSTNPGIESLEGFGPDNGSPYFDTEDLLGGSPAGIGQEMTEEFAAGASGTMLSDALNDLNNELDTPGTMPTWIDVPEYGVNTSTATLIADMP